MTRPAVALCPFFFPPPSFWCPMPSRRFGPVHPSCGQVFAIERGSVDRAATIVPDQAPPHTFTGDSCSHTLDLQAYDFRGVATDPDEKFPNIWASALHRGAAGSGESSRVGRDGRLGSALASHWDRTRGLATTGLDVVDIVPHDERLLLRAATRGQAWSKDQGRRHPQRTTRFKEVLQVGIYVTRFKG